jgi:hypothetical protein
LNEEHVGVLFHTDCFKILSDRPLPKEETKEITDIPRREDQLMLRKSVSLDDLKENDVLSGVRVDSDLVASKDLPLQDGGNTSTLESPVGIDSKKGQGKPESRLSSAVKKMISAFESSSPQVLYSSKYAKQITLLTRFCSEILDKALIILLLHQKGSAIYICRHRDRTNP